MQTAASAPLVDLGAANYNYLSRDLRPDWQTARVPTQVASDTAAFDPQTVWAWSDETFTAVYPKRPMSLQREERLVGRLRVAMQEHPTSMLVELPMPRLDAAHLSYRYNDGPWTQHKAGDAVPMVQWPFANRHPVFVIPAKQGELQLVWEIAHQGLFTSPVYLRGDADFRRDRFDGALRTGALLGLALVLSLVAFGAAAIFQRFTFFAVAMMTVSVGLAVFCQGGVAGLYIGTQGTWFNDASKFASGMLFGSMIPWTVAVVVSQKLHARWAWYATMLWLGGGLLTALAMLLTGSRTGQVQVLPLFLIMSLLIAGLIAAASVLRRQPHAHWALLAVLFYSLGILAPLAAYWGYADGPQSFTISSMGFLMSSLLLVYTLTLQYRHGRMVMTRAKNTHTRDVLTGLFNRQGFEVILNKKIKRMQTEQWSAAFLYIGMSDTRDLQERYGGEGFEAGMVQMAAAISSSVTSVDTVARIASNAFAVMVPMPRDSKLANALAQKIITRNMAIASHTAPMAQNARIAMAWLPMVGTTLPDIERRCIRELAQLGSGKRIAWVGGMQAHSDFSQGHSQHNTPAAEPIFTAALPSLPGLINHIERDMLGQDSEQLLAQADQPMKVMDGDSIPSYPASGKR